MNDTVRSQKGSCRVIAHRGLSGLERQNTAAAFVAAGNRSYFGIETDIHRTADGRFAVLHDADTGSVCGQKWAVGEHTLAELQSLILFDKAGTEWRADLRIPSLEEYLSICETYRKTCVIELKDDFTDAELRQILALTAAAGIGTAVGVAVGTAVRV